MASPQPIWHFLKHHDVKIDTGSYGKAGLEFIPLNNQIFYRFFIFFLDASWTEWNRSLDNKKIDIMPYK